MSVAPIITTLFYDTTEGGQKDGYKVKLRLTTPLEVIASIRQNGQKEKLSKDNIVLNHDKDNLSLEDFRSLMKRDHNRFKVILETDASGIKRVLIELKEFSPTSSVVNTNEKDGKASSSVTPVTYPLNLISMDNAHDLAKLCQSDQGNLSPLLKKMLKRMIDDFIKTSNPDQGKIDEVVAIVEHINVEDKRRVVEKLVQLMRDKVMSPTSETKALIDILSKFKRGIESSLLQHVYQDHSAARDPLAYLDQHDLNQMNMNDWVQLMDIIVDKLQQAHQTPEVIFSYLLALVTLLDMMVMVKMQDIDRKKHQEKFYENIGKFSKHSDPKIAFLGVYGLESLKFIKNNESTKHEVVRRGIHIFKGLAKVASSISLTEPWKILDSLDSIKHFKRACRDMGLHWKKEGFVQLKTLQEMLWLSGDKCLEEFKQKLEKGEDNLKRTFSKYADPFFAQGLIISIEQIVKAYPSSQMFSQAIWLLEKIVNANEPQPTTSVFSFFRLKDSASQLLVKNQANDLLNRCRDPHAFSGQFSLMTTDLFENAKQKEAPWLKGVREQREVLAKDPQVEEEEEYVIGLKGQDRETAPAEPMESKVESWLQKQENKVLLFLGHSGSGKSLFSKCYVLESLRNYQLEKPLPFFASLPSLTDPQRHLMDGILKKYGLKKQKDFLRTIPTLWFLDAYDEMYLNKKSAEEIHNLYRMNDLASTWPKAHVVITCRKDFLTSDDYVHFEPSLGKGLLKTVLAASFDQKDVKAYLDRYIEVRSKKAGTVSRYWKNSEEYIHYIDQLDLWEMVSNPFNLRVMAETLCGIVQRHQKNAQDQLKVTKSDLFDEFICYRYLEELNKNMTAGPTRFKTPYPYLEFALKMTRNMEICHARSISRKDKSLLRSQVDAYIAEQKVNQEHISQAEEKREKKAAEERSKSKTEQEKEEIDRRRMHEKEQVELDRQAIERNIKQAEQAVDELLEQLFDDKYRLERRACFLVQKGEGEEERMEFFHDSMYEHFRGIANIPNNKKRLQDRWEEIKNSYHA